jgi:hypothetical protein
MEKRQTSFSKMPIRQCIKPRERRGELCCFGIAFLIDLGTDRRMRERGHPLKVPCQEIVFSLVMEKQFSLILRRLKKKGSNRKRRDKPA